MSLQFSIEIDDRQLEKYWKELIKRGQDLTPLMRGVSGVLESATEDAFEQEADQSTGKPWAELAPSTIAARAKKGYNGKKLQAVGALAASMQFFFDKNSATYGTNKIYARTHQFGRKVTGTYKARKKGRRKKKAKAAGKAVQARVSKAAAKVKTAKATRPSTYSYEIPARPMFGLAQVHKDDLQELMRDFIRQAYLNSQ